MSYGLLSAVQGWFKRVQDRITRRRRDYPDCQLAELLSRACALEIPSGLRLVDPARAMAECYRVLQPGGVIIITTPQYWHVHKHRGDYYRFTDDGLRMLCRRVGFEVVDCWSRGGPILILFHVIRVNLSERWRPLFVVPFYWLAERMDRLFYDSRPSGMHYDALGWSMLARMPLNSGEAEVS